MKKNQVNAILVNQARRRTVVLMFVIGIFITFLISFSFFLMFSKRNKNYYIEYDEKSNIDYKVYLKENDFFDNNFLGDDKEYVASLIDYINANFNYKLSLDEGNVEYKYSYRVEANVSVKRKNGGNYIYDTKETLIDSVENETSNKEVIINENIKLNYNYYNDLIKRFITVYSLDDIESVLTINLYVNVVGSCEDFKENANKESVMSLSIPLTTKTVAIEISDNLINTENNVMQCKKKDNNSMLFGIMGVIFTFVWILLIILMCRYEIRTRTAENIYERALKKILNNYGSYIQKLSNNLDFKKYQLLKIDTFTDMLEIRDTIRQPILMKENEEKTGAYFVVPSSSKILYVYRLKVSDIKKEIIEKSKKEFDD